MDLDLSEEQKIIKKSAHDFLMRECPKELVREIVHSERGYSPELWQKMAGLGWMGLIIPEEYGGSGGSFLDMIVLLEEMGYNICPGPFRSAAVLGSIPLIIAGTEAQKNRFLPGIASGDSIFTLALTEPNASYEPSSIGTSARSDGDEYVISGTKLFVPDAHVANYLLCVAKTGEGSDPEDGITIFIIDTSRRGIELINLKTIAGDRQCEVLFDEVRVSGEDILGNLNQGWPIVRETLERAAMALSAEMVGGGQAVMDMALQYAEDRTQFNRPIGSFQAVQHHFANMWTDINASRYLLYRAAWKISEGIPASMDVAMAKARIGEAYRRVTILGHQVFGAIGFTSEHDMHLYHRRSMSGDLFFGSAAFHRAQVARELGL